MPECYYLGMQAAGFVLVGGLSTRMGQDKALLFSGSHPGSHPLVTDVARQVGVAAGRVALVGKPERYRHLGLECLDDLRPDLGPLAGIETALMSHRGDLNLIVACDMPGLTAHLLQALLQRAAQTESLSVVTRDKTGVIHPLCAVYRTACLPVIARALEARRLRLMDVIEELKAIAFDTGEMIWNVNTPQDWNAWRDGRLSTEGAPPAPPHGN